MPTPGTHGFVHGPQGPWWQMAGSGSPQLLFGGGSARRGEQGEMGAGGWRGMKDKAEGRHRALLGTQSAEQSRARVPFFFPATAPQRYLPQPQPWPGSPSDTPRGSGGQSIPPGRTPLPTTAA